MQTLKPVAAKTFLVLCASAWLGAAIPTAVASNAEKAQAWSEHEGFQRGQGSPADTGVAGEKCQDIDDANRKTECVRKARIKTETSVKKKEIEQKAGNSAEAKRKKAQLDKQAQKKQKQVEKKAAEAQKKEQQAQP